MLLTWIRCLHRIPSIELHSRGGEEYMPYKGHGKGMKSPSKKNSGGNRHSETSKTPSEYSGHNRSEKEENRRAGMGGSGKGSMKY